MPASLAEVLATQFEPLEPQATILAVAQALPEWELRKQTTMRKIWEHCNRQDIRLEQIGPAYWLTWPVIAGSRQVEAPLGKDGLLVDTNFTTPVLNGDFILKNNSDMFTGRKERNALRKFVINNPNEPRFVAIEQRLLQYKRLTVELQADFEFGKDLFHDKEAIQQAYGLQFDKLTEYPF